MLKNDFNSARFAPVVTSKLSAVPCSYLFVVSHFNESNSFLHITVISLLK
jgi:hypothetical protein